MFDIITIGDATIDTFLIIDENNGACTLNKDTKYLCLHYGDKIPITDSFQSVGGNASNVAVGAAMLGLHTAIVSDLGDDINAHMIKEELASRGVDISMVSLHKGADTRYSVVINYKAERTVFSAFSPKTYTLPKLPDAHWIYYTSMGSGFEKIQKQLLSQKKQQGFKLAINPGSYQIKDGIAHFKKMIPFADILFINYEEGELLTSAGLSKEEMIDQLHQTGVGTVVITDGEAGAVACDGTEGFSLDIFPIKAKAKTGAGDAFASGMLSGLIKGVSLAEALRWGTANAGGVIQKMGAHEGLLDENEMTKMLKKYKKFQPIKI